jgi:SAM-dependent methyltransferase
MKFFPLLSHSSHRLGLEAYLKKEAPRLEGTVLDVGSKDRRYDHLFSGEVTACDIQANPAKDVVQGDIHKLPFKTASFDNTLCLEVLEYTDDPHQALQELIRVTKPGGTILLSAPFLIYLHADKIRLTEMWYQETLKDTPTASTIHVIGNAYTVGVDILRRKIIDQPNRLARFLCYPLLWLAGLFLPRHEGTDRRFVSGYFLIITKNKS